MSPLNERVAVVTGGASGIGLAAARELRSRGASIVIGDIQDGSDAAASVDGTFVETDVTDPAAVEHLVAEAVRLHGRLDILFNNAGIEIHTPLAGTSVEAHRRLIDVNLNGVYYGLQSSIRAMMANDGPTRGAIVNTASVAGLVGVPLMSSYNAAKAAVVMLTKNAALEYGRFGIRVNAVCPGIIRTPMTADAAGTDKAAEIAVRVHALGRIGEPEEVARVVAFLVGDGASFVTGAALPVDGGMIAGMVPPPPEG